MRPTPTSHLRLARPSRDIRRAERFWVEGLGLEVLYRTGPAAHGGHPLLMVGWPDASWHLELVADPDLATSAPPSPEDLLVLYVGESVDPALIDSLISTGGHTTPARNPYWDRWGVTVVDPDGYRLVLSSRTWP